MATSKTRDKAAGKAQEAKGRLKSASGAITGKVNGRSKERPPQPNKRKGQLKDLVD